MAMVTPVGNLAGVEELVVNMDPHQIAFTLQEDAGLNDAAKMKLRVRAGPNGFRLLNPELLDCKCWGKDAVEDAMERMFGVCREEAEQELQGIDLLIATLNQRLSTPDHLIPERGPPLVQRGRGIHQTIYPFAARHGRFPDYDIQVPDINVANATEEQMVEARARDVAAQREFWRFNLRVLIAKRKIVEEKARDLEKQMRLELRGGLEAKSLLGCGYADYRFLCHQNDVDVNM